jgi:transcriptional regulator with XRE-family HTH domain
MRIQRSEHFNYPRGFQPFTTAGIPELNLNLVGQNIAKFRLQRGWAQAELAAKLQLLGWNITLGILARIESLRCVVTDVQIVFFSEVFSVPIEDLFPTVPLAGNQKMLQTNHCATRTSRKRLIKKQQNLCAHSNQRSENVSHAKSYR